MELTDQRRRFFFGLWVFVGIAGLAMWWAVTYHLEVSAGIADELHTAVEGARALADEADQVLRTEECLADPTAPTCVRAEHDLARADRQLQLALTTAHGDAIAQEALLARDTTALGFIAVVMALAALGVSLTTSASAPTRRESTAGGHLPASIRSRHASARRPDN